VFAWFGTWFISLITFLKVSIFQYEPHEILAFQDEHMETTEEPIYQIFVKTLTGQTITLDVKASDTTDDIKAKIADRLNLIFMQPSDYYLTFQSRRMEAGRTLSDYNILAENTLYMNGRVRGGVGGT
jgi:hypothetical protein